MAFCELPQTLREVDEGRALSGVRAAQTDDCDLCKPPCIGLEHGVDERGRADADRGHVCGRDGGELENLADGVLDALGDIGGGGRLAVGKNTAAGLMQTSHVDEDTVRVRTCEREIVNMAISSNQMLG